MLHNHLLFFIFYFLFSISASELAPKFHRWKIRPATSTAVVDEIEKCLIRVTGYHVLLKQLSPVLVARMEELVDSEQEEGFNYLSDTHSDPACPHFIVVKDASTAWYQQNSDNVCQLRCQHSSRTCLWEGWRYVPGLLTEHSVDNQNNSTSCKSVGINYKPK